ncbi:hypothetical protein Mycch_6047 (plasmid) [Mycolicibacterium chubuense NBB4]|uniref:PPE family protein n=1 Tax=Mycolicibacterium chubuense (strain NBB4) TaxID=710421 RepID=I4BTP0_MYCCN|nr:hypothetical protein [Mycolicibacterium chubuense]AFM20647.1 hypothetical protein Mycch_6047 [Mycolicibacterium chubuense NBB4]
MPRVDVQYAGLATVAATMTSTAASLSVLAAVPPIHPPLALDEVSTSAAARLTEHGAVLSSRALDGAAVLSAAAQAVAAVSTNMAEIDGANAASMAVGAGPVAPVGGPATAAAARANAVAADTPIMPMAPRPGEATAGLIEAGSSSTGSTFHTACRAYQGAFEAAAAAARTAENAVAAGITGRTGPQLSASLNKFASWADQMASHSGTVAQAAQDHGGRFDRTQAETPRTQQFTNTRQSLTRAQLLMMQTGGLMGSEQVARYGNQLQQLDNKATAAGVSYHLGELPQAPPPPPPVADIVQDGSSPGDATGQPGDRSAGRSGDDHASGDSSEAGADSSTAGGADPLADPSTDSLLSAGQGASPMGGDQLQQILPMAAMIPSVIAGALGGAIGAITSTPQQLMGAASQVMQGAAAGMQQEPELGIDVPTDDPGVSDFGGGGLGSGGGGGGGMEPAGLDTSLPPGGGALAAASAPGGTTPALPATSGAIPSAGSSTSVGAGMGGMGMMPPMGGMGGGGAGGGRATTPPDKKVVVPSSPNEEPVRGEVERRQTVSVDNTAASTAGSGDPAAPGRPRRRVVMPPDNEGGTP